MNQVLVSIIIPVFNSKKYLAIAIKSALDQTWENKEIIIIDDGSTDGSLHALNQFSNENLKIASQKNSGAAAARNLGLKIAKGEFIQFLDADDLLSVDKIEKQMLMISGSTEKITLSNSIHFLESSNPTDSKPSKADIELYKSSSNPIDFLLNLYGRKGNGGLVPIHAWLTPRPLIDKVGNWDESLTFDDDGEFFCRVVLAAKEIIFIENITAYYRKYKSDISLSSQNSLKAFESAYQTLISKENNFRKISAEEIYAKTFAASYYKLGVMCYPKYKELSKNCILKAKSLNKNYKTNTQYLGGRISNFIANKISWKLIRKLQNFKSSFK